MTLHFRGLLGADRVWAPICSSSAAPVTGDVTTKADLVTCPECRLVIGKPKHARESWDQRPASREFLDRKKKASGDES